jgi:hypothetical protein
MTGIEGLLKVAAEYGRAEGIELSTVSWRVFGDTKKIGAIVAGADIQTRRLERALNWFSISWPETTIWPEGVARPVAAVQSAEAS